MILTALEIVGGVILVLLSVVLVHEAGHFAMAKLFGVRVDEFSVGFGPRLAKRQVGETTYSLRALPAGGYVKLAGMLGLEGEADAGPRNFYRASIPKRLTIILAGIVVNFVFGGLLFTVYNATPTSGHVLAGEAAQQAGLQDGDVILAVDGRSIRHDNATDVANDLHAATAAAAGRPMVVTYSSGGTVRTTTIRPSLIIVNGNAAATPVSAPYRPLPVGQFVVTALNGQPVPAGDPAQVLGVQPAVLSGFVLNNDGTRGPSYSNVLLTGSITDGAGAAGAIQAAWRLGVQPGYDGEPLPQAASDGFGQIPAFVAGTFSGLYDLITNPQSGGLTGPNGVSGPVGIVRETATETQQGPRQLLGWIALISLNLGLINVLPIPFLDGGKAFLLLVEAIRRRRLDPRFEALTYAVGLALVVLFVIYVTIGDVSRSQ
jgi:regulator of sigma E protease